MCEEIKRVPRIHTHPTLEIKLELDREHCIVDKEALEEVKSCLDRLNKIFKHY